MRRRRRDAGDKEEQQVQTIFRKLTVRVQLFTKDNRIYSFCPEKVLSSKSSNLKRKRRIGWTKMPHPGRNSPSIHEILEKKSMIQNLYLSLQLLNSLLRVEIPLVNLLFVSMYHPFISECL